MGLYTLACIIVMMFAVLVATQEPEEKPELTKSARRRKGGSYVPRQSRESLSPTGNSPGRFLAGFMADRKGENGLKIRGGA